MLENPLSFETTKKLGNVEVGYSELMEICQGGPVVGLVLINQKQISERLFGGPMLFDSSFAYAPIFVRRFLQTGFKIARIDIQTFEIVEFGKQKDLIWLDRIENDEIFFFENFERSISNQLNIGKF